jgi:hypothetical protein
MMFFVLSFSRQRTRTCDWETFKGHEEFLEHVQRKGDKLGQMMMYERKQQMSENIGNSHCDGFLGQLRGS